MTRLNALSKSFASSLAPISRAVSMNRLDCADGDERAIRLGALELIDNARNRYRGPVVGVAIRPEDPAIG